MSTEEASEEASENNDEMEMRLIELEGAFWII